MNVSPAFFKVFVVYYDLVIMHRGLLLDDTVSS